MVPICVDMSGVCVNPAYQAVTEVSGTIWVRIDRSGRPVHSKSTDVDRLGAHVDVVMSDFLQPYTTDGLSSIPAPDNLMVYYAKTCSATGWRCDYKWSWAPMDGQPHSLLLQTFTIEGRSAEGLRKAQKNLWLVVGAPGSPHDVAVSDLSASADDFRPVACVRDRPQPGCPGRRREVLLGAPQAVEPKQP